jgi:uncharacterized LabA/DUF88 family protein
MSNILFIDGENFRKKVIEILIDESVLKKTDEPNWNNFNFSALFDELLDDIEVNRKVFYFSKIIKHRDTQKKSEQLIQRRRLLKNFLEGESQGFEVIIAGRVRGCYVDRVVSTKKQFFNKKNGKFLVFDEKGVDVKMAVDMVSLACDDNLEKAILVSSDSDLIPAIKEITKRGKECIYIVFESSSNKGISYNVNKTRLIRNSEIVSKYQKQLI